MDTYVGRKGIHIEFVPYVKKSQASINDISIHAIYFSRKLDASIVHRFSRNDYSQDIPSSQHPTPAEIVHAPRAVCWASTLLTVIIFSSPLVLEFVFVYPIFPGGGCGGSGRGNVRERFGSGWQVAVRHLNSSANRTARPGLASAALRLLLGCHAEILCGPDVSPGHTCCVCGPFGFGVGVSACSAAGAAAFEEGVAKSGFVKEPRFRRLRRA